ncbi:hypothetical protein niasHT_001797 [Heterodera trifolii]|uniref:Uncharacterized protein n=1 Tax=Heterodera trifolii TaxID=157864 RepID=A0ABD2MBJ5_9BILA
MHNTLNLNSGFSQSIHCFVPLFPSQQLIPHCPSHSITISVVHKLSSVGLLILLQQHILESTFHLRFSPQFKLSSPLATFHRTNKRTLSSHKQQQQKLRRRHEKRQLSISYSAQFANHRRTVSQEKKL